MPKPCHRSCANNAFTGGRITAPGFVTTIITITTTTRARGGGG